MCFMLGTLGLICIAINEYLFDKHLAPFKPYPLRAAGWYDFYAAGDPVPDGPIRARDTGATVPPNPHVAPCSSEVDNLDAIAQDHTTYWNNAEQFLPLLLQIFAKHGILDSGSMLQMSECDQKVLVEFAQRRKRRVTAYLIAGFSSLLLVPAVAIALGPKLPLLSELFLRIPVPMMSGVLQTLPLRDPLGSVVLSLAMVAVVVALTHQVLLFGAWRSWSRQETRSLFACARDQAFHANPERELHKLDKDAIRFFAVWACTPFLLFLLFLIVVPWLSSSFSVMQPWLPITLTVASLFVIGNTMAVISNYRKVTRQAHHNPCRSIPFTSKPLPGTTDR
jgi:hypothetical protein